MFVLNLQNPQYDIMVASDSPYIGSYSQNDLCVRSRSEVIFVECSNYLYTYPCGMFRDCVQIFIFNIGGVQNNNMYINGYITERFCW